MVSCSRSCGSCERERASGRHPRHCAKTAPRSKAHTPKTRCGQRALNCLSRVCEWLELAPYLPTAPKVYNTQKYQTLLIKLRARARSLTDAIKKANAIDNATQRTFSFTGVERENAVQKGFPLKLVFCCFFVDFSGKLFRTAFSRSTPVKENVLWVTLSMATFYSVRKGPRPRSQFY